MNQSALFHVIPYWRSMRGTLAVLLTRCSDSALQASLHDGLPDLSSMFTSYFNQCSSGLGNVAGEALDIDGVASISQLLDFYARLCVQIEAVLAQANNTHDLVRQRQDPDDASDFFSVYDLLWRQMLAEVELVGRLKLLLPALGIDASVEADEIDAALAVSADTVETPSEPGSELSHEPESQNSELDALQSRDVAPAPQDQQLSQAASAEAAPLIEDNDGGRGSGDTDMLLAQAFPAGEPVDSGADLMSELSGLANASERAAGDGDTADVSAPFDRQPQSGPVDRGIDSPVDDDTAAIDTNTARARMSADPFANETPTQRGSGLAVRDDSCTTDDVGATSKISDRLNRVSLTMSISEGISSALSDDYSQDGADRDLSHVSEMPDTAPMEIEELHGPRDHADAERSLQESDRLEALAAQAEEAVANIDATLSDLTHLIEDAPVVKEEESPLLGDLARESAIRSVEQLEKAAAEAQQAADPNDWPTGAVESNTRQFTNGPRKALLSTMDVESLLREDSSDDNQEGLSQG